MTNSDRSQDTKPNWHGTVNTVAAWSRSTWIVALGVGILLVASGRFWFGSFGASRAFLQGKVLYTPDCHKDFGLVPYEEMVIVSFNITNVMAKPLTIVGAKMSCGCTAVESLPLQLQSGEEKVLSVRVKLPQKPVQKHVEGQIVLYTNVDGPRLVLNVSGEVAAAKPDSVDDSIPPVQPTKSLNTTELSPPPDSGLARSLLERSLKTIADPAFFHALEMRVRGKVRLGQGKVKFDLHYVGEAPDRFWEERTLYVDSREFKSVQVINGNRGWKNSANRPEALEPRELEREKRFRQMFHLFSLLPDFLNDSSYRISPRENRAAEEVFFEVCRTAEPPIGIILNRKSGLVNSVFYENWHRDLQRRVPHELHFIEYKKIDEIMRPTAFILLEKSEVYCEAELVEVKSRKDIPASQFDLLTLPRK